MKRNFVKILVALTCLALLTNVAFSSDKKKGKKNYSAVNYEKLTKLIKDKKVTLLDCNGAKSFKKGHIPSAIDGTAKDLKSSLPKEKDALIVAYCGSEKCSAWKSGAKAAKKLGYTNVKCFKGGIKGWMAKGGKLESVAAKTDK
ncbi:MAG: sulfurtransferase [Planctomycetota bacterium]|nr:MAG: sulfurtransferase [Planctomycetota bacterium]